MSPQLTRIDKFIGYFSPTFMVKRAQARQAAFLYDQFAARKFDAAAKGRRTKGWATYSTSQNAETFGNLNILRDRVRDLRRNNPYASRAINIISSETVGTGIVPSFKPSKKTKSHIKAIDDIKTLWEQWGETTACDADGNLDIYGIQNLIMQAVPEAGEILIRRRRRFTSDGLPVPLQVQLLEADFIDSLKNLPVDGGGRIVQGIEYDAVGKKVAYWLFEQHPGDEHQWAPRISKRYPAEDIIHIKRIERAGQVRGIPWLTPAVIRLRDFDDYQDAMLLRQKLSACYTAFVIDSDGAMDPTSATAPALPEKLEPGLIEQLGPGKDVRFAEPPQLNDDNFTKNTLRGISVGCCITYEQLTGDLSNVTFSSARLGLLPFNRQVDQWRWFMLIPAMRTLMGWFTEAAMLVNVRPQNMRIGWTPPKREPIDPVAESNATLTNIRAGVKTLPEVVRENGGDFDQHIAEIQESNEALDAAGITLDSDPRKMSKIGFAQSASALESLAGIDQPTPPAPAGTSG